ncbi:YvcK family protein [Erysipelothrix sp. HDW6A]|uniref:gluconeogenesis factor YvcK family protein n=1 Tax=Erysipelothrix sp. HDW6A TaxID=2714928 RepID=UPI00140B4485|nr:uridine diphosphate-N-acetylglucosamine-binding protein YvcK [Erysipelothrix sp. HDW6A]QIK56424.1 YvcK family protein [Erysipelothrix sp. HDW6A]
MKLVVFGGGKGQSALLKGLKLIDELEISAIVTVADDGGSTGRLREEFSIPAMGDIRNVMLSLAESENLLSQMMNYRFESTSRSSLAGHNLGNLIFTALADTSGDFMGAISQLSEVLNVKGRIIPASTELITLCARMTDGTIVRGESNIPMYDNAIDKVYYDVPVSATEEAITAIEEADVILMGVGSIYTSILPNLIIPEIYDAVHKSTAKKIYYCNAMTQAGETDGFSGEDHVNALIKHTDVNIDVVVYAIDTIPEDVRLRYVQERSFPVSFLSEDHTYKIVKQEALTFEDNIIRHDPMKIKNGFAKVLEVAGCPLVAK